MSRSYKKNPGWTGASSKNWLMKRLANKKVRKTKNIGNGGAYKKVFCSWNIYEYSFRYYSKADLIKSAERWRYLYERIWQGWMK